MARATIEPDLLERERELAVLLDAIEALRGPGPRGSVVVLQGEPGIGKTALLQHLRRLGGADVQWMGGACEPTMTPTPLGAIVDLLDDLPPTLAAAVRGGRATPEVLAGMLALMRERGRPLVLAIDDVQWADSASVGLIRYLSRRIAGARALLVLALRRDMLQPDHPLMTVLGSLDPRHTHRLELAPLSREAVAELARRAGRSPRGLYRTTRGNPFFVSECLAGEPGVVSGSVRDAVLARVGGLSETARELLELVGTSPTGLEFAIADSLLDGCPRAADECCRAALLELQGGLLRFRHELARLAVCDHCPPTRAAALHAVIFDALSQRDGPALRLVHHAEHAGLDAAVTRLARLAGSEAADASAHRQAATLYAMALARGTMLDPRDRAALLVRRAEECMLSNQLAEAAEARQQALALHRALGDRLSEGVDLRALARLHWMRGEMAAGQRTAAAAIELLRAIDAPPRELAMAFATMAQLHLLSDSSTPAIDWGQQAMQLFEAEGDTAGLAYALNTVGTARLRTHDDPQAWAQLERSLQLALESGLEDDAARAHLNLLSLSLVHRRLDRAQRCCDAGLRYCESRDLDGYRSRLHLRRAHAWLEAGQWSRTLDELALAEAVPHAGRLDTEQAQHLRRIVAMRQGDDSPLVRDYWQRMIEGVGRLSVDPWYMPQSVQRAEAAWLRGDAAAVRRIVAESWPVARRNLEPWRLGQLACWMRRAGGDPPPCEALAPPCALELAGDARGAAAAWAQRGMPYEQALALAACSDPPAWQEALALAASLGAEALARRLRQRLRGLGLRPRGRNRHTRSDPLGLTVRQREVLQGLREGLTNRQIAARLVRSERTVDHHVAALIEKLGVANRGEAARVPEHRPDSGAAPRAPAKVGRPGLKTR